MRLTEARLRQIILEEVKRRLVDHYIDIEIARLIAEGDVADWKAAEWEAMKKKARNAALGIGATAGTISPIVYSSGQYEKGIAADRAANKAAADIKAQSMAAKRTELIDYINNTAAFRWGRGGEMMMQAPGKRGYGGTSVLPPSYSVIQQVYFDKMASKPRYGTPDLDQIPKMGKRSPKVQGNPDDNLASFFSDFDEKYMIDAVKFMQNQSHVKQIPGTGIESEIIMLDPQELSADYILPENGMSVKDYYNWAYFGQFLSADEVKILGLGNPEKEADAAKEKTQSATVDITPSQPPGEDLKLIPPQKNTWKEYKNRKKRLA